MGPWYVEHPEVEYLIWDRDGAGSRIAVVLWKSNLETYEGTSDPWFIVAAHEITEANVNRFEKDRSTGSFCVPAFRDHLRYTGELVVAISGFWVNS